MSSITASNVARNSSSANFALHIKQAWEWTGIPRYLRRRKVEDTLLSMSDYQLRDIGLNRHDVATLVKGVR